MEKFRFNKLIQNIKFNKKDFEELYVYYFPRIKVFIGRRYKDESFGEDIAQEFFLKINRLVITKWIDYPTTWVMKVCDNLVKTFIRKVPDSVPLNEEICASIANDNYIHLKNGGISEENIAALKHLDKLTLEIFVMHYYEGYKFIEIAKILGMEYDTVKRRHSRGLNKLKKFLSSGPFLMLLLSLMV